MINLNEWSSNPAMSTEEKEEEDALWQNLIAKANQLQNQFWTKYLSFSFDSLY